MKELPDHLQLLTVDQLVAAGVGSRASVYRLISSGSLPSIRRGRSVRVRLVDFEAWLEAGGTAASNVTSIRRRKRSAA